MGLAKKVIPKVGGEEKMGYERNRFDPVTVILQAIKRKIGRN
jgi:hypothetical protein